MSKDYYGKCGTCKYCDLSAWIKSNYTTSFKCTYHNYYVKADEKVCNKYEIVPGRSNDTVAKYDK